MTELPILFTGAMVRAILACTKTQTRRTIATPKAASLHGRHPLWDEAFVDPGPSPAGNPGPYLQLPITGGDMAGDRMVERVYPRWVAGDRLWVRETWDAPPGSELIAEVAYRADYERDPEESRWRPSIFMPRWACRILLDVVSVRVERAHAITAADVRAEGVPEAAIEKWSKWVHRDDAPATAYGELWDSINGKKPGRAWRDNPWVWRLEFKRSLSESEPSR